MGQKTNPIGLRLGIVKDWKSRWFPSEEGNFADLLEEDIMLRKYVQSRLQRAGISTIEIERAPKRVTINIHTARPGIVIGRKGAEVDKLRDELRHITDKDIYIVIQEIKSPELDAKLVADNIARQLEQRVSVKRAMKRAVLSAMRMGAEGIRIECAGRLGNIEIARREQELEGRVPLHTLRADIDFSRSTAFTKSGTTGVKVWICHGEILKPSPVPESSRDS